ncbi:hypothetical protein TRFO_40119 [Tritrichomonas foetus]|uniref:Beige/BEACH domain containing protein n=1 Tax=Tritrichomonas foetus TaxID=1144522 RepID=A0A1J4J860_9EUKA|nr:hypothetical protein TRFO_40119 [Tritrichomonas foetus]|eukprot:OHS93597.1 hypothetical protein TRFO_40119 [Tritrichomonas foetus]
MLSFDNIIKKLKDYFKKFTIMDYDFDSSLLQTIGSIISLRNPSPITELSNEDGFSPLISSFMLPSFSIIDLIQRKEFLRRCKTAKNFFMEYPFNFQFSEEAIQFLISRKNLISPKLAGFYNTFIIYNFLSWIQGFVTQGDDSNILLVMRSLLIYNSNPLNMECFFVAYYVSIENKAEEHFQHVYSLIENIFLKDDKISLPEYAYQFLPLHFSKFVQNSDNQTNPKSEDFSANAIQMMNLVNLILIDRSSQITTQVAKNFYLIIEKFIVEKFELIGLTFFANLAQFLPRELKIKPILSFPQNIMKYIENTPNASFKLPTKKETIKPYKFTTTIESNYCFNNKIISFPNGFDISENVVTFPSASFNCICDSNVATYCSLISKAIGDDEDILAQFVQEFSKIINIGETSLNLQDETQNTETTMTDNSVNETTIGKISAYLVFCQINEKAKHLVDLTQIIIKSSIFSPEYLIFNSDETFKGLNTLRHFSLNLILNQSAMSVDDFLRMKVITSPLMTAEVCERLLQPHNFQLFLQIIAESKRILRTLCIALCSFCQNSNNGYDPDLDKGRFSLFRLLSRLLSFDDIAQLFFEDSVFLSFLFALLFEPNLQDYIFCEIKNFLIEHVNEGDLYDSFIQSFYHFFEQCMAQFKTENGKILTTKVFKFLFDVFTNNCLLASKFSFIIPQFCDAIEFDDDTADKFQYFELIFRFIEFIGSRFLTIDLILLIKNLIVSKKLIECDDRLFNLIKNSMVMDDIIIQPLLAKLMIYCFWNNDNYHKIIHYFSELCQINSVNSIALREAEIDSFIVDELRTLKLTEEEVNARLSLLEPIAIVISSPIVVQNFISLLKDYTNYLYFLNKLIVLNYSIPIAILPFSVIIENEFKDEIVGPFSFAMWLFIENDKSPITMFNFNDCEIVVCIKNKQLIVNSTTIFEIPMKKWFFFALTFNNKNITAYLNMNVVKILDFEWESPHLKRYKIGGYECMNGRFGNFGFFKNLNKLNIRYFVESGPRNISEPERMQTIEYYTPSKISDVRATFLKTAEIENFAEIFLQICKIELILPLFAQLDDDRERLTQIFSVLRNSLLIDESQQKYFQEIKGFAVITHLLISTQFKGLTFDFYMKFFNLCGEIAHVPLRNDLIEDILINFDLWTRSMEFHQITNHWKTILFAGFEFISQELISFIDLLGFMRMYLFYEPIETEFIKHQTANSDKIGAIRSNIMEILTNQYKPLMDVYDYAVLMSHCISCHDVQQVHDLLLFFTTLADESTPGLKHFMLKTEAYIGIHHLLITDDPLIVPTTLTLIREFARANLISDYAFDELMVIYFEQLKYSQLSDPILNKISILIQHDMPELFPICSYFTLLKDRNNNDYEYKTFNYLFEKIEPTDELCCSPNWAIWAVYGAIVSNNSKIFSFLAKCCDREWYGIYCMIDRVCEVFNFKNDEWKGKFLLIILELCETGKYNYLEFIELVTFFILFRKKKFHNDALINLYNLNKSKINDNEDYKPVEFHSIPFSASNVSEQWYAFIKEKNWLSSYELNDLNEIREKTFDIEQKLLDSNFLEFTFIFGLRFSNDGKWVDKELAERTLMLYNKLMIQTHQKFRAVLSHFLRHYSNINESINISNEGNNLLTPNEIDLLLNRDLVALPYALIKKIRHYSLLNLDKSKRLFTYSPRILKNFGNSKLENTNQSIINQIEESSKNWRFLWSHMTSDHAPWDLSYITDKYNNSSNSQASISHAELNKKHFKRDFSINTFMCPWKTKLNRHFDIHEVASKMRDSGNFEEEPPKPVKSSHPLAIEEDLVSINKEMLVSEDTNNYSFIFTHECEIIKIDSTKPSTFSMNSKFIKVSNKIYKIEDIKYVFWRKRKQYPTAIEIYFVNGKTLFINFPGLKGSAVANKIVSYSPKNAVYIQQSSFDSFFSQTKLTEKWLNHEISNFEYLMYINVFGGRSFNDPSQYPFMPWIITNYEDENLDLNDKNNYRDLDKPVGALGKERLDELVQRLEDLRYFDVDEFLYSCFVSTPLSVFLFNVRVEPYTSQHIEIQGGRFDTPLRQFFSILRTYDSAMTQMNDYRELIPEFFYDNEFLENQNNFDLGLIDKKVSISDVELPPWAKSAMDFVYTNRKALESKFVSSKLNNWIDLLFGEKQKGKAARESNNLYKSEMYDDVWERNKDCNDMRRAEIETIIEQVGQIPPQLFKSPHPARMELPSKKSILSKSIYKDLNKSVSFATFHEIDNNKIQIKMLLNVNLLKSSGSQSNLRLSNSGSSSNLYIMSPNKLVNKNVKIETINLEFGHEFENDVSIIQQSVSLKSYEHESFFSECRKFIEIDKNVIMYLSNSDLDVHITNLDTMTTKRVNSRHQKIQSISNSEKGEDWFSVSFDDSRTNIYNKGELKYSIPTYRKTITCSALSVNFGVSVSGTDDGSLIVASIYNGATIRSIDLSDGNIPIHVSITPSWGFILVNSEKYVNGRKQFFMSLFTINGDEIRTTQVDFSVDRIVNWSTENGFDFAVILTKNGKMIAFEVFYMSLSKILHRSYQEIVAIDYLKQLNLIIAISENGSIALVPYIAEDIK